MAQSSSPIMCEMAISRPGGPFGSVEFYPLMWCFSFHPFLPYSKGERNIDKDGQKEPSVGSNPSNPGCSFCKYTIFSFQIIKGLL